MHHPFNPLVRRVFAASISLILVTMLSVSEGAEQEPASFEQIQRWVKDLDSNSFIDREFATERLVDVGIQAIQPIVEALEKSNPELAARGVHVLREMSLDTDEKLSMAGQTALEQVAKSEAKNVSRRATAALTRLAIVRQDRSIKHLQSVGAKIVPNTYIQVGRAFVQNINSIEIGEAWKGEEEDFAHLKWLSDFQQIILIGEKIDDGCVAHAAHMKNLEFVTLKRAKVTNESMRHLASLKKMKQLEVMYCPINDMAVQDLAAHKSAAYLKFFGTRMSKDGAAELRNKLTGVNVDHRHGAFLGVGCETHDAGCLVQRIQDNTAATRADLRIGDVITKYEGQAVESFEKLTEFISQNSGGETIKLEILRGSETLEKSIKLGEW